MKNRLYFILVLSVLLLGVTFYTVFNSQFFTEELVKHYNGISYYYIAARLTQKEEGVFKKLEALTHYVYQNVVQGEFEVQDLPPMENLIRGIGWCDQVAHLFIRLIEPLDIRGYLCFLRRNRDGTGASPHSIALITPDTKKRLQDSRDIIKEGIVADIYQGVILKNKSGNPATFHDICSRNVLESQEKYFDDNITYDLSCNMAQIFLSNTPLSLYGKKRKIFYKYILPALPTRAIYIYQDFVLSKYYKKLFREQSGFLYCKARHYHIYERFDEARKLYETIVATSEDSDLVEKCLFFEGILYVRMAKIDCARDKFKRIIRDYPQSPWFSLAQKWLSEIS